MDAEFSFAGYKIETSSSAEGKQIFGFAACPICGRSETSEAHGRGERHARVISFGKIMTHMQMAHGVSEEQK